MLAVAVLGLRDVGAEVGSQHGEHGGAAAQRILHRLLVARGPQRWPWQAEPGISSARGACSTDALKQRNASVGEHWPSRCLCSYRTLLPAPRASLSA